ncbi:MAG: amidohydrolase [Candidatus Cloacimonetes bacterium]|nr:amidohydrolase [Candidatus Cloacimonadota bacterium]
MFDLKNLYIIRKKFHRIPELAFQEIKTQDLILSEFADKSMMKSTLPLSKEANTAPLLLTKFEPTGLLYEYANGDGDYILFRADMDALPIKEETGCDFQSEHSGVSHACGHDIHLTILIGLIHYVIKYKLKKNILFLFQPAEEGHGGAEHIIKTGVFEKYKIKAAFALHITGQYPTGSIGIKSGIFFGIPQEFDIEFFGKSGHVATPQKGNDAFMAGMLYYQMIKNMLSNRFPAQEPIIFHIGKISSGSVRNSIPDYCKFEGTFRCLKKEVRDSILNMLQKSSEMLENFTEIKIKVTTLSSYDPVVNDDFLTKFLIESLPEDINVHYADYTMTGEDFGFFSGLFPSVLFWLGTNSNDDLHSNKFLPDEKSIEIALRIYKNILEKI